MQRACAILSSVACTVLHYFSTLSHARHDFRRKVTVTKCVFWFSLQLLSETFLILRWNGRDMIKNVYWSSCKSTLCCPILTTLEFSRHISEKSSNIKFHENPSSGSRVLPCGRTKRHDEANSRFSQLPNAPKNKGRWWPLRQWDLPLKPLNQVTYFHGIS